MKENRRIFLQKGWKRALTELTGQSPDPEDVYLTEEGELVTVSRDQARSGHRNFASDRQIKDWIKKTKK